MEQWKSTRGTMRTLVQKKENAQLYNEIAHKRPVKRMRKQEVNRGKEEVSRKKKDIKNSEDGISQT